MKTYVPNVEGSLCPYCGLDCNAEGVEKTLINKHEDEWLVECTCSGRYFVIHLDPEADIIPMDKGIVT